MSKDAYYFPHDSNAKDDPKCVLLIEQLGMEGYGIYWMLIETLRDQPEYKYPVALLPALARRYNTTPEKVRTVVGNYGLFIIEDDTIFFSDSLNRRMQVLAEKRLKHSDAGRLGAARRWGNSDAITPLLQCYNDDIASKVNKSKGKNKEKDIEKESADKPRKVATKRVAFVAPSLEELRAFVTDKNLTGVNPEEFMNHYTANGWMVGKNKMKDWRAAARNWSRRAPEFNNKPSNTQGYETKRIYQDLW